MYNLLLTKETKQSEGKEWCKERKIETQDKSETHLERIGDSRAKSKIRKGDGIICRDWSKKEISKGMYVSTCLPEKGTIRLAVMVPGFWMSPVR